MKIFYMRSLSGCNTSFSKPSGFIRGIYGPKQGPLDTMTINKSVQNPDKDPSEIGLD